MGNIYWTNDEANNALKKAIARMAMKIVKHDQLEYTNKPLSVLCLLFLTNVVLVLGAALP